MSYRDEYKSEWELRREKQDLGDRWHDPNVHRRWAAEDRIREINREFHRREDRRMEEEEAQRRQERDARDRREAANREQQQYDWEMDQYRRQQEQESCEPEPEPEDDEQLGVEEGDTCNRLGCDGIMTIPTPKNCSCHLAPPCHECENALVTCNKCGYEVEQ